MAPIRIPTSMRALKPSAQASHRGSAASVGASAIRPPEVSLLIPAKDSAHSLENTVLETHRFLSKRYPDSFEIILIPTLTPSHHDQSHAVAERLSQELSNVIVVTHHAPVGKGAALRTGFLASRGRYIFMTDADLPYDLDFFELAAQTLAPNHYSSPNHMDQQTDQYDLVTGNRRLSESKFRIPVKLLPIAFGRHKIGLLFNHLVRQILPIKTSDTQSGIKAMSRRLAQRAFNLQRCPGFFFDLEIFLTAIGHNFKTTDLPVTLHLRSEKSTVRIVREALLALFWLSRISLRYFRNYYAIMGCFSNAPFLTRLFLNLRWRWTPYTEMAALLPKNGDILDLGCGHGLLSLSLALGSGLRHVIGIDHDAGRILIANTATSTLPNLKFTRGDFSILSTNIFSGIAIIDVLHYFTEQEQQSILTNTFRALTPGGVMIFREVNPEAGVASTLNKCHEFLMTRFGFTQADKLHYRTVSNWESLARSVGFEVKVQSHKRFPFADVLFICYRPIERV